MYDAFALSLMVTHGCNLRCSYCYTGRKFQRSMDPELGRTAIDRAARSLRHGGTLDLSFFGGEPLLEAAAIRGWIEHARERMAAADSRLRVQLTTNGTVVTDAAWELMTCDEMDLTVSHDGLPEVHDRHRVGRDGVGRSKQVLETIRRLIELDRPVRALMVVRPDTVETLPEGIAWLREQGVTSVAPSLDLWTEWTRTDAGKLNDAIHRSADVWFEGLPDYGVSWFDEKLASLSRVPFEESARCRFGDGQIAVAPSGNLYPCERLIGEDETENSMRLPGHALEGTDFLTRTSARVIPEACAGCALLEQCGTYCRCSNFVRTGDVHTPDGLLCLLDQACVRETCRVFERIPSPEELETSHA